MRRYVIILLAAIVLCITSGNVLANEAEGSQEQLIKAKVIEVVEGEPIDASFGEISTQSVTLELLEKPYKGEQVVVANILTGQPYYDLEVARGDRVLVQVSYPYGELHVDLVDFYRLDGIIVITILFGVTLVLIGGFKGFKALLSLIIMAVIVGLILLPLILQGFSPVLVTVGIASILSVMFIFFVSGINIKSIAALGGTVGGLIMAGILAFAFGKLSSLTGLSSHEAQILLMQESTIDYQGLLFAGIIIGALGAILDVGMSVASSMEQLREENPDISLGVLIRRGINVGQDMLGTMSNTLILAYLGSSLPLLLLFQVNEVAWRKIINLDLIATEVIRALAGSIGLALAIPLTAVIGGFLEFYFDKQNKGGFSHEQG
ncbi:MAG: YibE/F family protein [Firmicutes bacterium]|nr:YibE/F family protein [Bacillota bacterium]